MQKRPEYPPTMGPPPSAGESIADFIFDPSTQHYTRAFRRGDPVLPPEEQQRWVSARRKIMTHLVSIATSGSGAHYLVLRGSLALKSCLGEEAREPGDIDWVIQPSEMRMDDRESKEMLEGIIHGVIANPKCDDVWIEHQNITSTDIWTYDRAPGHRIAFPWRCGELPPAIVHMDFVFEQPLHAPAINEEIRFDQGTRKRVTMASPEESLAWKLSWLASDMYPQGKDLYDAVLLAELIILPPQLLKRVMVDSKTWEGERTLERFPFARKDEDNVDWENFLKECPWVQGTAEEWTSRLLRAMHPVIDGLNKER